MTKVFSSGPNKLQLIGIGAGLLVLAVGGAISNTSSSKSPEPSASVSASPRTNLEFDATYTTKPNYIAAPSEAELNQAVQIVADGDREAFNALLNQHQIIVMQPNLKVYLEGCASDCNVVKVRPEGETITLYTLIEAIEK
jgi:hypothetical protein